MLVLDAAHLRKLRRSSSWIWMPSSSSKAKHSRADSLGSSGLCGRCSACSAYKHTHLVSCEHSGQQDLALLKVIRSTPGRMPTS